MPKSVGARTHPCLTPLLMGKGSEEEPSYWTVPFISSWKKVIILSSLGRGGHPILCRCMNRPDLLTRWNTLVRSIKAMYRGRLCSQHFSCSSLRENIMLIVDHSARNPHCASGYTRSASVSAVYSAWHGRRSCRKRWEGIFRDSYCNCFARPEAHFLPPSTVTRVCEGIQEGWYLCLLWWPLAESHHCLVLCRWLGSLWPYWATQ